MSDTETIRQQRRVAIAFLASLLEDAMENGLVPHPSAFGLDMECEDDADPVYDWAHDLLNVCDICEDDLLPHEQETPQ